MKPLSPQITLGSLFDGIGGFPLAGTLCDITPVWASEIEPFPMKVTAVRFPDTKQLGDVTKINGADIEPVDIITFGSPCQDLSVAGNQLGIHKGQRSNLFFEAIRIIKEMRNADKASGRSGSDVRPRFAVWENVPGAFSSNKGEDFREVLEAFAGVVQDGLYIPRPEKWNHAGGVVGNEWSVAWRVYDAQYWGVPQRRRRIYLVADFASERALEILFESEGLRGHPAQGGATREGTATDSGGSVGRSDPTVYCLYGNCIDRADTARCNGSGCRTDTMYTLNTIDYPAVGFDCRNMAANVEVSATLQAKSNGGQSLNYINPVVYRSGSFGAMTEGFGTLRASGGDCVWGGYGEHCR